MAHPTLLLSCNITLSLILIIIIVYTDRPQHDKLEDYHIRTLFSVLGSEEAAKGALLYTYKHAACGFSAKLTPKQVEKLSKQPAVLQVVKDETMRLHESPAKLHSFLKYLQLLMAIGV